MIFQYSVTHSLSLFAHRVGTRSDALRHAFARVNREILTFQSHGVFHAQDIWCRQDPVAQPGKTNMQVKQRAPRMHCDSAQLTHHQNKHVDYIIKTRSLDAKKHYMVIVMPSSSVLTPQWYPSLGGNVCELLYEALWHKLLNMYTNMWLLIRKSVLFVHGQHTRNEMVEVFTC